MKEIKISIDDLETAIFDGLYETSSSIESKNKILAEIFKKADEVKDDPI